MTKNTVTKFEIIDYFIVSDQLKLKICDVVNQDHIMGSDHCPVVLYLSLSNNERAKKVSDRG